MSNFAAVETAERPVELEVRNLEVGYGDFQVLWGVSLTVPAGKISCLLGTNGSGKSTLLNGVAGMVRPMGGEVHFEGQPITGLATHTLVDRGLVLVPERRRLFPDMSVWENLWMGGWARRARPERHASLERVYGYFPDLRAKQAQRVGELSGGQQQMVAISRGLMAMPRLLILDEPFLGISQHMIGVISEVLRQINGDGMTILLIDQDVRRALTLAHRAFVLDGGRLVLTGDSAELLEGDAIRKIYLGARADTADTQAS
jgi:branched-chain amino acid transport system ATP-binding protein